MAHVRKQVLWVILQTQEQSVAFSAPVTANGSSTKIVAHYISIRNVPALPIEQNFRHSQMSFPVSRHRRRCDPAIYAAGNWLLTSFLHLTMSVLA
jgi:hypothetical protein